MLSSNELQIFWARAKAINISKKFKISVPSSYHSLHNKLASHKRTPGLHHLLSLWRTTLHLMRRNNIYLSIYIIKFPFKNLYIIIFFFQNFIYFCFFIFY